ncbi:MAG: carboxypeptidase-like regulatory domain-containing protein [Bryobacteraceae bacterium]
MARIKNTESKNGRARTIGIRIVLLVLFLVTGKGLSGQERAAGQQPAGPVVPAISGTVVDAITGKPVAGVDVTLRAETTDRMQLRYESCRTSPLGRFRFPSSVEPKASGLLGGIGEIAITVNIPFVPLAQIRAAYSNDWVTSDGGSDASQNVLGDPLFTLKSTRVYNLELKGPRVNNKAYFPMAVQFLKACGQAWDANCISMETTRDVRVPLIPVLDGPAGCKKIADRDLSEGCRQLQVYRSAFLHVETMAQVQADKTLCNTVDGGRVSKICLDQLHSYVWNPERYEGRLPVRMEIDPAEEALILTPIAGMGVVRHGLGQTDPFDETATYYASYRRQAHWPWLDAVRVSVDFIGDTEARRLQWARLLKFNQSPAKQAGHFEMFDGSPLFVYEAESASQVAWISGDKLITISVSRHADLLRGGFREVDARMAEATPEQRRELIRSYLRKYPLSN